MNIVFMGTPDFAVPSLKTLVKKGYGISCVVTQPDRPKGRKQVNTPPPVKVAAEQLGLPVWQPENIRSPECVKKLQSLKPDVIVTAAFGQILPRPILETPPHGCINVHASLLPKYRGGAPIHWAIMNGEKETGITLMYMVEALDAGDILVQRRVAIARDDTVGSLHDKLSHVGASLLCSALPAIVNGEITPVPQNEKEATFAPNIRREDEKMDWTRSAEALYNQVRGLNPWPVAYTVWESKPLKVSWAEIFSEEASSKPPGTVTRVEEDGFVVACGRGQLKVKEVQPAGKRRMGAAAFLRGANLKIGSRLGDDG